MPRLISVHYAHSPYLGREVSDEHFTRSCGRLLDLATWLRFQTALRRSAFVRLRFVSGRARSHLNHHRSGLGVGAATVLSPTGHLGTAVEICARLRTVSERNRSTNRDPLLEAPAIPPRAGAALLIHRPRDRASIERGPQASTGGWTSSLDLSRSAWFVGCFGFAHQRSDRAQAGGCRFKRRHFDSAWSQIREVPPGTLARFNPAGPGQLQVAPC